MFSAASLWVAELGDGLYAAYDGSAAGVLRPATEADTEQPERVTLTLAHMDETTRLASRNVAGLTQMAPEHANAYAVLNSSKVILTKDSVEALAKTFVKEAK